MRAESTKELYETLAEENPEAILFRDPDYTGALVGLAENGHQNLVAVYDAEGCIDCDICARVCPMSCISHQPEVLPTPEHLKEAKERARTWARGRRKITLAIRSYADREIARKAEA